MRTPRVRLFVVTMLVLSAGERLLAHDQIGTAQGLLTGFLHPLSGLDHVVAMIAVGLWGAQLGPPALWLLPVTFPMVMAFGGFLGLIGLALPGVEIGIAPAWRPTDLSRRCAERPGKHPPAGRKTVEMA